MKLCQASTKPHRVRKRIAYINEPGDEEVFGLGSMPQSSVAIWFRGESRDNVVYLHHAHVFAFELIPSCFFGGVLATIIRTTVRTQPILSVPLTLTKKEVEAPSGVSARMVAVTDHSDEP